MQVTRNRPTDARKSRLPCFTLSHASLLQQPVCAQQQQQKWGSIIYDLLFSHLLVHLNVRTKALLRHKHVVSDGAGIVKGQTVARCVEALDLQVARCRQDAHLSHTYIHTYIYLSILSISHTALSNSYCLL
eukprot:c17021_g1_i2 orf=1-390(-)